jgi:hypothetical protein
MQGGVLAMLLYSCESWYFTAEAVMRLRKWRNECHREMHRIAKSQALVHQITSMGLQKRTGVFSLENCLASRAILWAGRAARMHKGRLHKNRMLPRKPEPLVAGGKEMAYARSLERHLKHFIKARAGDSTPTFTEWVLRRQRAASSRCGTSVSSEDTRRFMA